MNEAEAHHNISGQQGRLEVQTPRGRQIIPVRFTGLQTTQAAEDWIVFARPEEANGPLPPGSWGYQCVDPLVGLAAPQNRGILLAQKIRQKEKLLVKETDGLRTCPQCQRQTEHVFCTRCGQQLRLRRQPPGSCALPEHTKWAKRFAHCPRCGDTIHELPHSSERFQNLG